MSKAESRKRSTSIAKKIAKGLMGLGGGGGLGVYLFDSEMAVNMKGQALDIIVTKARESGVMEVVLRLFDTISVFYGKQYAESLKNEVDNLCYCDSCDSTSIDCEDAKDDLKGHNENFIWLKQFVRHSDDTELVEAEVTMEQ